MANEDNYIEKYIKKTGYVREKISNNEIPPIQKIRIYIFYGDIDSTIMFAKCVYNNKIKDKNFYDIIISWHGFSCIFDKADEFWSFSDEKIIEQLYNKTDGLQNTSVSLFSLTRSLNESFINVYTANSVEQFYKHYLSDLFKSQVQTISLNYNKILSMQYLNPIFSKFISSINGIKPVSIMPLKHFYVSENYKKQAKDHEEKFYIAVIQKLSNSFPVLVIQNAFTFDLSRKIESENVVFVKETNIQKIISMIHLCGNYIDFFANSFSLGFLSNAYTFSVVDKPSWFQFKKYEDYEFLTYKKMYKNYCSFNYFTNFDTELDLKFIDRIISQIRIYFFKDVINSPKQAIDEQKEFEVKNFSNRKLHYLRTNKVFFLRNQKNA